MSSPSAWATTLSGNPVFGKELRTRWRGWRLLYLPIALLAVLALVFMGAIIPVAYRAVAWQDVVLALGGVTDRIGAITAWLLTPALIGGSVAGERKQLTLESLLLTRLTVGQILRGKLAATLVPMALALAPALSVETVFYLAAWKPAAVPLLLARAGLIPLGLVVAGCVGLWASVQAGSPGVGIVLAYVATGVVYGLGVLGITVCVAVVEETARHFGGQQALDLAQQHRSWVTLAGLAVPWVLAGAGAYIGAVRHLVREPTRA